MAMPTTLKALTVLYVLVVLAADQAKGQNHRPDCPSFSCGPLGYVRFPFRQVSDPPGCGYQSYELICSDANATIRIDNATYYVSGINYNDSTFWIVDADLVLHNTCPLPRWVRPHHPSYLRKDMEIELAPHADSLACFVKCSQKLKNSDMYNSGMYNSGMYKPIACLNTNESFVYMVTCQGTPFMNYLEPSCRYLAMAPLRSWVLEDASYAEIVKSMKSGFAVRFPFRYYGGMKEWSIKTCLLREISKFRGPAVSGTSINDWIAIILLMGADFADCVFYGIGLPYYAGIERKVILITMQKLTLTADLCRFVLAPLAVLIFLVYKYWKTRIRIDAVEKFLQMQQMLGPTRYAYTDITAVTSHFIHKLGQGGYGSVFKGVLLPGNVHVAVKMLDGNSNCNGEDFISEVSTIGRIHHVNVVRLVGFCLEEMRQALVYEYMPRGSLDKYIFSAERSFSWDRLAEIALGIARGIDYLHQGCEMQILHFDIKPHNILLDSNFVPKVADFGLAKLYPRDNSFVPSRALRGTIGYIAPEMISRSFGVISSKSDVYSFGMLLLEMAGGRRNADPNAPNSSQAYYPSWVYDRLTEQEVCEISPVAGMHELERKLCIVGLWCIQMKSHERPTMSEVIEMLEGGFDGLQMPSRPFFGDDKQTTVPDSYPLLSELTEISDSYVSRVM
ncbi:rust resistance kinase Lr10-like isoform X1 [Triticum dicoccoides]|uniref:rust resistance kinase Lr10-like isoform X1 n=1 Tax=Triticum dicoccoides TaxID=85692 RepID=UPI000E7AFAEF|nr:rust resistance kinase Lr10-like isoform X1 [Triticum dicoccoides]XP_037403793.1 rust resistance kinase Lr10-like isoform X1 [Triticum dicoccoides]XP_037403794.1 rust resistance kinase Lr10-like isoform X1 [Triticum dicoccoides]